MGTSSTIQFIKSGEAHTIYRNMDGYPGGMIPELQNFLKWNGNRCDESGYTAANFVLYSKITAMQLHIDTWKEAKVDLKPKTLLEYFELADDNTGASHTGCGVTDNDHQGEEYFYIVNLDRKTIKVDNIEVKFGEKLTREEIESKL